MLQKKYKAFRIIEKITSIIKSLRFFVTSRLGLEGLLLTAAQAVTVLSGVGVGILLARGLGVEGYGQYVFIISVVQAMMIPLDFGLPTLVVREVAIKKAHDNWSMLKGLLNWSVSVVVFTIIGLAITVGIINMVTAIDVRIYLLAVALAGTLALMRLASAVLRGMQHTVAASLPDQVLRPLSLFSFLVIFIAFGSLTTINAVTLHIIAAAFALISALFVLRLYGGVIPPGYSGRARYESKSWTKALLPLGMQVGAGFLNARIDVLMLGILADSETVGLFGLGILIGSIASMPDNIIRQMTAPRIARLYANNRIAEINGITRLSSAASTLIATLVLIGIFVGGRPVVEMLVGAEYIEAIVIASIIALGGISIGLWSTAPTILNMTGHEAKAAKVSWISAALNALLNLTLIPFYGAVGAAIATTIATAIRQIAFAIAVRRYLGVPSGILQKG